MLMSIITSIQNRFIHYRIRHYQTIDGFISRNEAIALYCLSNSLTAGSIVVEIGSWKGKSTYCLAKGLRKGKVIAIDPFDCSGDDGSAKIYREKMGDKPLVNQFREKLHSLGVLGKVEIFQGLSSQFINKISSIDLLFIDANHSKDACEYDFVQYSSAVNSGGYIALHDFDSSRPDLGPTWVVNNKILNSKNFEFVDLIDSLWICRKIPK